MFTDLLNNPINVDDYVLYPQSAGSSSATIQLARVVKVEPTVTVQTQWGTRRYYADSVPKPGEYKSEAKTPVKRVRTGPAKHDWEYVHDPDRAYRLTVQKLDLIDGEMVEDGRPVRIVNVDRVTVVTGLLP